MIDIASTPANIHNFIERWLSSGAAERANYQIFLAELCDILDVPRPEPTRADETQNAYVFEKSVTFHHGDGTTSSGRIDLYKRGSFVLEAKQGSDKANKEQAELITKSKRARKGTAVRGTRSWDEAMIQARGQAEQYARALPTSEGRPPFLVVVDVGHSVALYSEFSRTGGNYVPFPDSARFRIPLKELEKEETRELLRLVWTDPLALDPTQRTARITRDIAQKLARLAKSLEASGHAPERVAAFLMRAIFTMFAEDVRLIPKCGFTELLESLRGKIGIFPDMVEALWRTMAEGGFSPVLKEKLLRFNGGLFESAEALPVTDAQLELLIEASQADWREVEPAIFGTLLEQALDPIERHRLGAHYTPRAYVERLVLPTIIEPLREEWTATQAAAVTLAKQGKLNEAVTEIKGFHERLCQTRVLDPACGTGNFLYVTLEHLKRLEGEVLIALEDFGERQAVLLTVDPHQLLGLEVNPRAAAIADLVLWIGYLQWHFRTRGDALPAEPVLKKFHNIENRDAVLAYDAVEVVTDDDGKPVMRWDGRTTKKHPVTGKEVPDETALVPLMRYTNPRKAQWQEADFIIGNPPFIGSKRMRTVLNDGYVEALREAHEDVPETSDYVMYWWNRAANLLRKGKVRRFGFVTTNSITQTFNRKVVEEHLEAKDSLSLLFAIPDHPWVDVASGAAVRIAMSVASKGEREGILASVLSERREIDDGVSSICLKEQTGRIASDFNIGADVTSAMSLKSNARLCWQGCKLVGKHFQVMPELHEKFLLANPEAKSRMPRYWAGNDITQLPTLRYVIDFYGLTEQEARQQYPLLTQHLINWVKPERDQNRDKMFREKWWLFGRPRPDLRKANERLTRYIATSEVAKHRTFVFLKWNDDLVDGSIVAVAHDDPFIFGVLSSQIHKVWALATSGTLEDRPRYQTASCFDTFPFPIATDEQKHRIREHAEALDAHRKLQQAVHPRLTMTEMYNVLQRLSAGEPLTDKERVIHEQGLVSVLKGLHEDLDAAVFAAYGWQSTLDDAEILTRLVELNHARAAEERSGHVRWLRPAFQHPQGAVATQAAFDIGEAAAIETAVTKQPFPSNLAEQARAVRNALIAQPGVVTPAQLAKTFQRARADRIKELLQTLVLLGQARQVMEGKYAA